MAWFRSKQPTPERPDLLEMKRVGDAWALDFSQTAIIPQWPAFWGSAAGPLVTLTSVMGLTAVTSAIRVKAETLASVPLKVYRGRPPNTDQARDSWQWYRLHEQPNDDQSAFEFFQDVETVIEAQGNAFIWKAKTRPKPRSEEDIQLFVLDSGKVGVKREDGVKKFRIGSDPKLYGSDQVLHIRGWSPVGGADLAPSPIALHRDQMGNALGLDEYQGRFFSNNAQPGGGIQLPADSDVTREQAQDMLDYFEQRHAGLANAHRPAIFYNGANWVQMGINMQDAQYIESRHWSLLEIARMFRISAVGMLGVAITTRTPSTAADDFERFLKVDLAPVFARIESALQRDTDLFGPNQDLFPEFFADAILRPDMLTRYNAYKAAIQAGIMTPDDVREKENMPPHPNGLGKIPQITPVGGAPNPPPNDGSVPSSNGKVAVP